MVPKPSGLTENGTHNADKIMKEANLDHRIAKVARANSEEEGAKKTRVRRLIFCRRNLQSRNGETFYSSTMLWTRSSTPY